jgi:hypothetical protein
MLRTLSALPVKVVKQYLVKGWCGKELCSTHVAGEDDESVSSDDSAMPPLQQRKGRQWVNPNESDKDDDESEEDTQEQDNAVVMNNSSDDQMLDYLRLVAIEKGIREPNIDSWASSVKDKLINIDMHAPRDVVANIITINRSLQDYGRSMLHNKTLYVLARVLGVEFICPQDINQIATALSVFKLPSDNDDDSDDYGEVGFFDDWSSSDNWTEDREESDDDYKESDEYCFMSQTTSN